MRVVWATEVSKEPSQISLTVRNNGTPLDLQDEANALAEVGYSAIPNLAGPVVVDWPGFSVRPGGTDGIRPGFHDAPPAAVWLMRRSWARVAT